jgi:hypothetical protein
MFIADTPPLQYCTGYLQRHLSHYPRGKLQFLGVLSKIATAPRDKIPSVSSFWTTCRTHHWQSLKTCLLAGGCVGSVWKTGGKFPKESTYHVPSCWIHTWPRSRDRHGCLLNIILGRVVVPDQWPGCRSVVHML